MDEHILLDSIQLPADMEWPDRFQAWALGQVVETSVEGALIVHEAQRQAGRRITLESGNSGNNWWGVLDEQTVEAVLALADAGGTHVLSIPTSGSPQVFNVHFHQADGNAVEVRRLPRHRDRYAVTLRFIVVE